MKTMKYCLVALLLAAAWNVQAQRRVRQMDEEKAEDDRRARDYERTPFWDKVKFGGSIGGYFGAGSGRSAMFIAQPFAAYQINENALAGLGVTYLYWSREFQYPTGTETYSDNAYGFNLFARHRIYSSFFAHAEYMPMNFTSFNGYGESKRVWGNALYLGGGLQEDLGGGGAYVMVLYNVLYKADDYSNPSNFSNTFYASPWDIRIGFMF